MTIQERHARHSKYEEYRGPAVALMRSGMAGPQEIADMLGIDDRAVRYWQYRAGIDWPAARLAWLQETWRQNALAVLAPVHECGGSSENVQANAADNAGG